MPRDKPSAASATLISSIDFEPRFLTFSRSSSVFCTKSATTEISAFFRALTARAGSGRSSIGFARLSCRYGPARPSTPLGRRVAPFGHERREVVPHVGGGPNERLVGGHRAVRPDLDDQLL